ncbi:hypothetical protein RYX36_026760 [Vicia faba]
MNKYITNSIFNLSYSTLYENFHGKQHSRKVQYPLDSSSYKIINEIGVSNSAVVYKAICIPINSTPVAIKSIDLDRSRPDLDDVQREEKTLSLLSHPNILKAICSFTVDHRLYSLGGYAIYDMGFITINNLSLFPKWLNRRIHSCYSLRHSH